MYQYYIADKYFLINNILIPLWNNQQHNSICYES